MNQMSQIWFSLFSNRYLYMCLNCYIRQLLQRGHRLTLFIDPGDQPHCSEFGKSEFPRIILPIPRYPFPLKLQYEIIVLSLN